MPLSPPSAPESREECKSALVADVLQTFGMVQIKAWGTSMLPSLWPGDLLTIKRTTSDQVVPGDIVLVIRGRGFTIHRAVERQESNSGPRWTTKGDATSNNDPHVAGPELLGRVTAVSRGNRNFAPSPRVSIISSSLAFLLRHCNQLRGLCLRMNAFLHALHEQPQQETL
jgi:hypothetical protein